jgi:tetratricopeptide (TPR) repeat protein
VSVHGPSLAFVSLTRACGGVLSRVQKQGVLVAALGLGLASARADLVPVPPAAPDLSTAHITDGEDRLMSGVLDAPAETKSQADALYANALVSLESPDSDAQKALGELRQVAKLDPQNVDVQLRIAHVLLQTGQLESAFEQLQAALKTAPNSTALEAILGYTQHLRGQNDEALRLSTKALTKDPTQAASMRVLLEIAGDQNDLSGAVIHIEDILKAGGAAVPSSAWLDLARIYVEVARSGSHALSGDLVLKTLLPIYQQAAAKSPPDVERWTLLSEAYQDLGRKYEALSTERKGRDLEPDNVDIILRCARLEMDVDEKDAALKDYRQAYNLNPSLTGLREMLGRLYLDNEKFDDAIQLLQDALVDSPDDPGLEADLGVACEGAHRHADAETWFARAFASPLCPPEAYLKRAVFQLNDHQIAAAGQTLADAEARFPESAKIRFYQAIQNRYAKNYTAALACLSAMRGLASGSETDVFNPAYYLESAMTLGLAQKSDRIEPLLREGLEKYPGDSDLMNELAFFWADRGEHLPEALDLSRRAAQVDPQNGAIEDTLGWVYFKIGEVNAALPYLQRAAIMTNNDPVVLQHLGDALLKAGHRRQAITVWRHALAQDPTNHDLATRISTALAQAHHAYPRSAP